MTAQAQTPSLAELQRWMRWIITEPRGVGEALTSPWTLDPSLADRYKEPARLLDVVEESAPLSTRERLGVYANAYFYRLLESLAADYPTVHRVLGEGKFHDVVAHYLMRYPSHSPNIGDLGEAFPQFIKEHPLSEVFPFLHELAALERAVMECLFTSHLPALESSSLQKRSEEDWAAARFVLDPTIRLMKVRWPVDTLWKCRPSTDPAGPVGGFMETCEKPHDFKIPSAPMSAPRHLLLCRDDNWVNVSLMDAHPWMALQMLKFGTPLGAVCEALSKQKSEASETLPVMEWFFSWVARGFVGNILWQDVHGECR